MDYVNHVPLLVGEEVVGTASVSPDGKIDLEINSTPIGVTLYNQVTAGTIDHVSFDENSYQNLRSSING